MKDYINAEPIEMTSSSLRETQFSSMEDEPTVDTGHDFSVVAASQGNSFNFKVRLHSLDVSSPGLGGLSCAKSATISLGNVPMHAIEALMTSDLRHFILKLNSLSLTGYGENIERLSISEEDVGSYSLIIDIAAPMISKSIPTQ